MSHIRIGVKGRALSVQGDYAPEFVAACRAIPGRRSWDPALKAWVAQGTLQVVLYLIQAFPTAIWTEEANRLRTKALEKMAEAEAAREAKASVADGDGKVRDYRYRTEPFVHQGKAFLLSRDREAFALLMEMGTGKTKVVVDTAAWLYQGGQVTGVLVVCPNSVKGTWEDEVAAHLPEAVGREVFVYHSGMTKADQARLRKLQHPSRDRLAFLVMNVEAFSFPSGLEVATKFLKAHRALMAVDESTRIKTPSAKRTKNIIKAGKLAAYRRILTGTPITQGPLDLFAQFQFLDPNILGFGSMYAFRNRYAVLGGFQGKEVIGYANLDELQGLIEPHSFRVTKAECLDLPEKTFTKRVVTLSTAQRVLYDQMARDLVAEFAGSEVAAPIVLTQMLRLQQITGGFLPVPEEDGTFQGRVENIPGPNPKVDALLELLEEAQGKAIIWARFRPEIDLIAVALGDAFGPLRCRVFHGGVSPEDREEARRAFQDPDSEVRYFVANAQTGGLGLTLTQARTVVYFSNSFSLEDRLQSEDRAHRAGLKHPVTYVDLVAADTLDVKLLAALRSKKNLADLITGDTVREWI